MRSGISRAGPNRKWTGMIRYDSEGFSLCMVSQYRSLSRCRPKSLYGIMPYFILYKMYYNSFNLS